jgi:uncharacterized protein YcbK (DUF882 family)
MSLSRRRLVLAGAALAGTAALGPPAARGAANANPKRIELHNLHTDEHLEIEYFRGGAYVGESFARLQAFLKDYRNGEQHVIDPKLMDYLVDVAGELGMPPAFSVISGYRSPETNGHMLETGHHVAQNSLHMQGRAIDIRMAGVDCAVLAERARNLKRGGVGYYRAEKFVHMDTGMYRTWNG